ncbi:hypothetical protein LIPSTDRAFT_3422 [Lipomyces starkeyi NRRL Y-11557]|uniref:Uncharacterized protein n=1 Tax=Lipomyces starkeyi NRRL Y-11557 TaxID=675824 RepID=A0A1E3Q6F4_LIPST|nr:hypothetical protein LIPSTDRAFT_3422 [Lipomyces starkeyi NRRL Y-11557]
MRGVSRRKLKQKSTLPWLPLSTDAAELGPCDFGWDDWLNMTYAALREFVAFDVVHTPQEQIPAGRGTSSTLLAFEHFAILDCCWSRACWAVLERDFRENMVREFAGACRSRIAYLGIWLQIPWVLQSIIYRTYSVAPCSPEFAGLEDGFSRGFLERPPVKFDEELGDEHDFLAPVRVPPLALPFGFRVEGRKEPQEGIADFGENFAVI